MTNVNAYTETQVTPTFSRELLNKNALFYTWFTNHTSNNLLKVNTLERLFQTNIDLVKWTALADYFTLLYKVVFYTNLINTNSAYHYKFYNMAVKCPVIENNYVLLYLWQALQKKNTGLYKPNYYTSKNLFQWNLDSIIYELDNVNQHVHWLKTQFYLFNIDINKINTLSTKYVELANLNTLISQQLNVAKQYRWLYKYSLIHRNLLSSTINLTNVKKLLNSGFYSLNLFNKNLWGSEHLTDANMPQYIINTYHNLLYYNLFNNNKNVAFNNSLWFDTNINISNDLLFFKKLWRKFFLIY